MSQIKTIPARSNKLAWLAAAVLLVAGAAFTAPQTASAATANGNNAYLFSQYGYVYADYNYYNISQSQPAFNALVNAYYGLIYNYQGSVTNNLANFYYGAVFANEAYNSAVRDLNIIYTDFGYFSAYYNGYAGSYAYYAYLGF